LSPEICGSCDRGLGAATIGARMTTAGRMDMILQPGEGPIDGRHYLRSRPDSVRWGWLPNRDARPVIAVRPGEVVTVDTVSHEGILDDFGRDPVGWFGRHGVAKEEVLRDALDVANEVPRTPGAGPHVVTGPIAVPGTQPGDLLRVEVLGLRLRVPYGVISNRHGYGALPGEYPQGPPPDPDASAARPEGFRTVSVFTRVDEVAGRFFATMPFGADRVARYPLAPFLGVIGVATDTENEQNSTPPGPHGGNLDVAALQVGARLYLPVQVPDALAYVGDPHFAQGNGEVSLTALEGSLRADLRFDVLRGESARRSAGLLRRPFGETDEHWIPIGLHESLDEAMRDAVRNAIEFLATRLGMERHLAYAYLSAAADFEVSQVVDGIKGVHCLIRKRDFGER
jgi:acetamidase/formamidase